MKKDAMPNKRCRKSSIFLEQGAALRSLVWADIGSWAKAIENYDSRFFIGRIAEKKKATKGVCL